MKQRKLRKQPFNMKHLAIASIILNILLLTGYITCGFVFSELSSGYALVNASIERQCSEPFKAKIKTDLENGGTSETNVKRAIAGLDYGCRQNGADEFYEQGLNNYLKSLHLPINN